MKKIDLTEEKFNKIKEKHLKYCKKHIDWKKLKLTEKDCKLLFTENPFNDFLDIKRGYGKFKRKKKKLNFIQKYASFRSPNSNNPSWSGAKLIEALGIDVCPYCGQQYFSVIKNKQGKLIAEATLDHYYDKSTYPYLALNLYNMIPVCRNCNSTFKLNKKDKVVNPYIYSLEEHIKFYVNNIEIPNYLNDKPINVCIDFLSDNEFINNHINILELENRYNYYQNIIKSTIKKRIEYCPSCIENISKLINKSTDSIEANLIKQDILSENEPFLKFKSDIWNQISN